VKQWIEISFNKVFFFALLLLIAINLFAVFSEDVVVLESSKPLFIPAFLIFYFIRNKFLNVLFVLFLLTSFLGDTAFSFASESTLEKCSNLMYFLSYICLIAIILYKFNFTKIDKVVGFYLLFILLINAYFLFTLYNILKTIIADSSEVLLFALKGASLIVLLFVSFAVYLTKESKLTILFLMLGLCMFFSDVLNYVNIYYISDWRFVLLDRVLHAIGLFFLFNYVAESSKVQVKRVQAGKEDVVASENILA
jgi:hypothetical protein